MLISKPEDESALMPTIEDLVDSISRATPVDLDGGNLDVARLVEAIAQVEDGRGLTVHNGTLDGDFPLDWVAVDFPLRFHRCVLAHLSGTGFEAPLLEIVDSEARTISLVSAEFDTLVITNSKVHTLDVSDVDISAFADLSNLRIVAADLDNVSLRGDDLSVGSNLKLDGLHASGRVTLLRASAAAFSADRLTAEGVWLQHASLGRVGMTMCQIGALVILEDVHVEGTIDLSRSSISGSGSEDNALAISGDRLHAGRLKLLGVEAGGGVSINGATIEGELRAEGMTVERPFDGRHINGEGLKVGGNAYLDASSALSVVLDWAEIKKAVVLPREVTRLSAFGAKFGTLDDGFSSGSSLQLLDVRGCTYDRFRGDGTATDATSRSDWLGRQTPFARHPYRALQNHYEALDDDEGVAKVAFAKHRAARANSSAWKRSGSWLLEATVGYGYRKRRSLLWAVGLVGVAWIWALLARSRVMVPSGNTDAVATTCGSTYPCFEPLPFAIDTVVPLVDLGQTKSWIINWSIPEAWGFWLSWTFIVVAGWALGLILAGAFAGLVDRR